MSRRPDSPIKHAIISASDIFAALFVACLLLCSHPAFAQQPLYTVSSKAQGATFDLVVTEVKREPHKSYLSVPGFHDRTAAGARWLMCAYTDLAVKRGFSHWVVVYPAGKEEILVVGFSNSPDTSLKEVLGDDFTEHVLGKSLLPVEKVFPMYGMRLMAPHIEAWDRPFKGPELSIPGEA